MRVRSGCEWNSLFYGEPNDFVARIKLVDGFAPPGGGKFDREIVSANKIQCFVQNRSNVTAWAVPVNFDQIEMGQTVYQTGPCYFANAPEVRFINFVNIAADKLFGTIRNAVEHLFRIIEVMNRAENKIQFFPVLLDPFPTARGGLRIIIKFDSGANPQIGMAHAELFEFIEIYPCAVTIVVGKSNVGESSLVRTFGPRLQQFSAIWLHAMTLRMRVIV